MKEHRLEKVGNQLRGEIASLILRHEVKDPRVNEFLTINRVEVSRDFSYAKVYVSSFMDDAALRRGVEGLQSAAGFIQSSIAKKVSIYRFPRLTFVADFSGKESYRMVRRLNALEQEERESSAANEGAGESRES